MPRCPHCGESHGPEFHFCGKTGQPLDLGPRLIGQVLLDRFRVVNLLGEGPVGAVLEVEEDVPGESPRRFAAKMLHPRFARDRDAVSQFLEVAEKAGGSGHPHIARVLATGRDTGGAPLVVRELMEGESLDAHIAHAAPMPVDEAVRITRQILDGLAAAHAAGAANLDLSPGDVFLVRDAAGDLVPKLVDFGEAHLKKAIGAEAISRSEPYFAPEMAREGVADERADLWATATMLHEMLAGELPYGTSPDWSAAEPPKPKPVRATREDVEPLLEAVLIKALSADPARRYRDPAAFEAALARATGARPSLVPPVAPRAGTEIADRAAADKATADKATADKATAKAATDKAATDKAATDEAVAKAATDEAVAKAATDKAVAKAATDKAVAKAATDKAVAKAATDEAVAKAATDKAATDEAATDKAATDEAATRPASKAERSGTLRLGEAMALPDAKPSMDSGAAAWKPKPSPDARAAADEDLSAMIPRRPAWVYAAVAGGVLLVAVLLLPLIPLDCGSRSRPVGGGGSATAELVPPTPDSSAAESEPEPEPEPAAPVDSGPADAGGLAVEAGVDEEEEVAVEPEPEPEPAPAPAKVRVTLRATPAEATITVDGSPVASNPFELEVEPSAALRRVQASAEGHVPRTLRIAFDRERTVALALEPRATRPATGGATRPATGGATRPATGGATRPATGGATRPATGAGGFTRDNPFD